MTRDIARALLEAYRGAAGPAGSLRARAAAARAAGRDTATDGRGAGGSRRRRRGWTGAGPDVRDPQWLSRSLSDLVSELGWQDAAAAGKVQARWGEIVGADIASHCDPVRLTDGNLLVQAESTAWATQLRLLERELLTRIQKELGESTVRSVRIQGPTSPQWRKGPLRVRGRGPRDTYG